MCIDPYSFDKLYGVFPSCTRAPIAFCDNQLGATLCQLQPLGCGCGVVWVWCGCGVGVVWVWCGCDVGVGMHAVGGTSAGAGAGVGAGVDTDREQEWVGAPSP